ncbi:hypothetical protein EDD21DRAFT_367608 [Dissophora ornata]|nr:hypothetical protein EDD21DRAFT_367608 [Dissophora ornata]
MPMLTTLQTMRCMLFLLLKGVLAAPIDPSLNVDDLQGGIADFSALSTILGAEMVADATASGYRRPFMIAGVPWSVIGYIGFVKHVITAALGQKILKRLGFEGEDVALLTKGGFEDIVRAEFESTSIGQLTATINCIHRETQKGWDDSQSWWCISTIFEGWYQAIDSDLSMMLELDQYNKLRARQIRNVALNIMLGSLGVLATVLSTTFLVFTGNALYLSILLIIGGITSHVWVVLTYNPIIAALDKCSVEQIVLRVAVFNNKGSQLRTWNITLPENMAKAMLKNRPNQAGPDSISVFLRALVIVSSIFMLVGYFGTLLYVNASNNAWWWILSQVVLLCIRYLCWSIEFKQPTINLDVLPFDTSITNLPLLQMLTRYGLMKKEEASHRHPVSVSLVRIAKTNNHFESVVFVNPRRIIRSLFWLVMRRPIAMDLDICAQLCLQFCGVPLPLEVFQDRDKPVCVSYSNDAMYIREISPEIFKQCQANNINSVLPFLDNDYLISHMLKRAGVREMEEYRQWEMSGENLVDLERLEIEPTDSRIRKDIPYNPGKCTLKNLEVLEAMQKDGEKWSVQRTYDNIR